MFQIYLSISILIGIILVIDGFFLLKADGNIKDNSTIAVTTTIEFLWAIISIIVLATLNFPDWTILIPTAYLAHNILGWLYGTFVLARKSTSWNNNKLYVPIWYVKFGLTFGAVFSISSLVATIDTFS